ncbi:hypothetical protein AQJ46_50990 [Streptomyces canus]|uniref:Uncharacterized protein n=1 Tax=Streptomyces canus TaxID=58343 RepID=A0A101RJP0_9ACTN|nr:MULTISPECIES: hypothetical protein [Streptomyces]KUN51766.1 hypothetical protein AQJ46_50990 [Streptomyces canus]MDI5913241.1 hypothetical protein [Streptomyces sp. 12257]
MRAQIRRTGERGDGADRADRVALPQQNPGCGLQLTGDVLVRAHRGLGEVAYAPLRSVDDSGQRAVGPAPFPLRARPDHRGPDERVPKAQPVRVHLHESAVLRRLEVVKIAGAATGGTQAGHLCGATESAEQHHQTAAFGQLAHPGGEHRL